MRATENNIVTKYMGYVCVCMCVLYAQEMSFEEDQKEKQLVVH